MSKIREALVSLNNAGVCVSDKWLVRGVSLEVSHGEIVTLIGPNGHILARYGKACLVGKPAGRNRHDRQPDAVTRRGHRRRRHAESRNRGEMGLILPLLMSLDFILDCSDKILVDNCSDDISNEKKATEDGMLFF